MMHHLNTLYVTTQGASLRKEGEAVIVRVNREAKLRVPLHNLEAIVCFGRVFCSPALMAKCAERGVAIAFLAQNGRFLARVLGFTPGNVLLRREQYRKADDPGASSSIARAVVTAKIANSRTSILRALRDNPDLARRDLVEAASRRLAHILVELGATENLETIRGLEGDAARVYFGIFDHLILAQKDGFRFSGRSRRPPMDNINALLSFVYSLLVNDTRAACEAAGLDAAVGFLHVDRPGRPSLALDLMEELRPFLADRLVLTLVNRQQVESKGFIREETGGVRMDDATRREVLTGYQKRKQEEITHPFLEEKVAIGLVVHLQARLLARHLRGDQDAYAPFLWR